MNLVDILLLYIAFRMKQVLCDFILQPGWMALGKAKPFKEGGIKPLLAHATIHAVMTSIIMLFFAAQFWWLAIVDFFIHAFIDKLKALITYKGSFTPKDNAYWWLFGLDQEAHNFTHLAYIALVAISAGYFKQVVRFKKLGER